jgi:hypothetical protein
VEQFSASWKNTPAASFIGLSSAQRENGRPRHNALRRFAGSTRLRGPLLKFFLDGFLPFIGAEVKAVSKS